MDVAFSVVPFGPVLTPSLGSSILQSSLAENNISSRIFYGSLDFADLIGIPSYLSILESPAGLLIGEYVFSHAAFPDTFESTFSQAESKFGDFFKYVDPALKDIAANSIPLVQKFLLQFATQVLSYSPKIVVCSSMFQQNSASLAFFHVIKRLDPTIATIMGGCNTEYSLGLALLRRSLSLDFICSGAGEFSLPLLCRHLIDDQPFDFMPDIPGVVTHPDLDKFPAVEPDLSELSRASLSDLDYSPTPSFHDYFSTLSSRDYVIKPAIPLESSRGCWWGEKSHCTFCGLNGSDLTFRSKNDLSILKMMDDLSASYECNDFTFVDNIIPLSYFNTFLPSLAERSFNIFYETKANLSRDQISLFKNAGVNVIQPGIESLLDGPLRLMRKGTNQLQNLQCLRYCSDFSVIPQWSILWNFPGENFSEYEQYLELIPKIHHLYPPGVMASIRFDKFSPYHSDPECWGLQLEPLPSYTYLYPDYSGSWSDIAYFFRQKDVDYHPIPFVISSLSERFPSIYRDVFHAVSKWQSFWSDPIDHPVLKFIKCDDSACILDTRTGVSITTFVSSRLFDLLTFLDKPSPLSAICSHISCSIDTKEYRLVLSDLSYMLDQGWIILSGKKYFSIVTIEQDFSYHPFFPFGRYFPIS